MEYTIVETRELDGYEVKEVDVSGLFNDNEKYISIKLKNDLFVYMTFLDYELVKIKVTDKEIEFHE